MPPQGGETTLATVFSDIHYYFSPPDYKPLHHRFDKGSYVYVHDNAGTGRGRIEIANNVGTAEQDAFTGALETAHISFSYDRPTTVSIALSSPASQATQQPWQLPGYDLRNERKFMYRLNSLDLYLWTPEDAIDLVEALTKIKSIGALDIQDAPDPDGQATHGNRSSTVLSPVVQQLEQAALSPPFKRQSTDTAQSPPVPQSISSSAPAVSSSSPGTQAPEDAAAAFAPIPYNPAAPAAPETRVHREKTPPPPDAEAGIGFAGGAGQQTQAQSYPHTQQQHSQVAGQPQHPVYGSSPPPNVPQQQQQIQSFAPTPTQGQQATYPSHNPQQNAPSFATPPASTPQSPPQAYTHTSPPPQQAQHPSYSNYSYTSNQQSTQPAYNVHQQFYIPTQAEAGKIPASQLPAHSQIPGQPAQAAPSSSGGKVAKVERGVNKLFKKLEKY